ncbi:MAG TPA: aminoglycoside phosphotransferase family protein [Baekduia sp.]|nr:aminoglycoside phosphotransferase family protein [Baekduia sp.]
MTVSELDRELSLALGAEVTVIRREPAAYRSSHCLEDLVVRFENGETQRIVRKDLAAGALLAAAARAKPDFALNPRREIDVYRHALTPLGVDAPRLLAGVADDQSGCYQLLLEYVDGSPLWQIGDIDIWCDAAAWLGRLHRHAAPQTRSMLAHDRRLWDECLARALAVVPGALDAVLADHEAICARLGQWPASLIHGEFYPSNVIVTSDEMRLCVLDWEMAGHGPGVLDLAALISGSGLHENERERIVRSYHSAWHEAGGAGSLKSLREALICARIQVALQWIGWSADWRPPAEHAHDWLSETLAAASEFRR